MQAHRQATPFALSLAWLVLSLFHSEALAQRYDWNSHLRVQTGHLVASQLVLDATVSSLDTVVAVSGGEVGVFRCDINETLAGSEFLSDTTSVFVSEYLSRTSDGLIMVPPNPFEPQIGSRYLMFLTGECDLSARKLVCPPQAIEGDSILVGLIWQRVSWTEYRADILSQCEDRARSMLPRANLVLSGRVIALDRPARNNAGGVHADAGEGNLEVEVVTVFRQSAGRPVEPSDSISVAFVGHEGVAFGGEPGPTVDDTVLVFAGESANGWRVSTSPFGVLVQSESSFAAFGRHHRCGMGDHPYKVVALSPEDVMKVIAYE